MLFFFAKEVLKFNFFVYISAIANKFQNVVVRTYS